MKLGWTRGEFVKDWHGNRSAVAGENDEKDATGGQPQHHCVAFGSALLDVCSKCKLQFLFLPTIISSYQQSPSPQVGQCYARYLTMPLKNNGEESILKLIMYNTACDRGQKMNSK